MSPGIAERYGDEPCCACDRPLLEAGHGINWVILDKRAAWDDPAAGNVRWNIPNEYAMALVCDQCIDADRDPVYALRGEDLDRVPIEALDDLPSMRERILTQLPDDLLDAVADRIRSLLESTAAPGVSRRLAIQSARATIGGDPETIDLAIDALVDAGRLAVDRETSKPGERLTLPHEDADPDE